jgi:hypothetical protein
MVAGRIPFEGDTSWTLIFKHINEPPPPIEGIQPAVQKVLDQTLAKKPENRYQSARELAADYMEAIGLVSEANTLRFSLPHSTPRPATLATGRKQAPAVSMGRIAAFTLIGLLAIGLVSFVLPRFLTPNQASQPPTEAAPVTSGPTESHIAEPTSSIPVASAEPIGLLRFQDGTAPADSVTLSTSGMALPPEGSQYEAWLIQDDGELRIPIGNISFDAENNGSLSFVDSGGRNLLGIYSGLEVTIEPNDGNPSSSNDVAFSVRLPENGLTHVRHLLFSFGATPNQVGFIHGLEATSRLLDDRSKQMLAALEAGNQAEALLQAENMLNLIVGHKSEDHKDWNGNGSVENPSDGYGLLFNGDQLGYIQGTFTHADLARTSADATENMLTHGDHVKISADNLSNWTGQLRSQLISMFQDPGNPNLEATIRQAVVLAGQIRAGVDVNGNENIEPIPGEGGAITAHDHAYYMADMLILPLPTP